MRTLALLLPASLALHLHAQHSGIGIKAGAVMSGTRSGDISSAWLPGATAGGYFALRAGPRLELQPEAALIAMGASSTLPDGGRVAVRTLYAQVPVSAKLFIGNVANLHAGFTMGRLLLAQQAGPDGTADVTGSYAHWDDGVHIGAGADLVSGHDIALRYYMGLVPILADDPIHFPRNRALMATYGYRVARLKAPHFTRRRS